MNNIKLTDYLSKGERWYIRRPGAKTLSHVSIQDITDKTVEIKAVDSFSLPERYRKDEIEWIEKTGPFQTGS